MELMNPKEMMVKARISDYAIGAFNIYNQDTLTAVVEAAAEAEAPVMLQTAPSTVEFNGVDLLVAMVRAIANRVDVPVVLHLDHAKDLDIIFKCIEAGYTSVMFDGSNLPWEQNVELASKVVTRAHASGVAAEAELGHVGGQEDQLHAELDRANFTDPDKAAEFVAATGIDSLAVAIGTAHGIYKGEPRLDFELLREIALKVSIPLVLHGASGVPEDSITRSIKLGISKINIATELKLAFAETLRDTLIANPEESDPRKYLAKARRQVSKVVLDKMRIFGVVKRA